MNTSADRFARVDAIFDAALDLDPAEQTAFVTRECGDDVELRNEVLRLLRGAAWFGAWLRYAEGERQGAMRSLEDSLNVLKGDGAQPPPALAMPYVTVAEWRLAAGDAPAADSLALLGRVAAAVDSLALQRSAYAGRAELVRARAHGALGDPAGAKAAAERALVALANGYGPGNAHTLRARLLRDSVNSR